MADLGGRPPLFETPADLKQKVDQYFEWIKGEKNDKGEYTRDPEHVTITGIALYLGFESRQSFYDYEKKDGFTYIIKRARMIVENSYEQNLRSNNVTGSIFALKNMGWTDKQEVEQSTTIKDERIDASKLTDEELRFLAEIQRKGGAG